MRSRKPETRATMSTCLELSVCATKVAMYGIAWGVTVITETTGGGRCGAVSSLEHAARSRAQKPTTAARITTSLPSFPFPAIVARIALELEPQVHAVLVEPGSAERAAGLQPLAVRQRPHEGAAADLPAYAERGYVADVVSRPRRLVRTADVAPPRIPPAAVLRRRDRNIRIQVGRADPDLGKRREIAGKHVPRAAEAECARVHRARYCRGSARSGVCDRRGVGRIGPGELPRDVEVVVEVVPDAEPEPEARIGLPSRSMPG